MLAWDAFRRAVRSFARPLARCKIALMSARRSCTRLLCARHLFTKLLGTKLAVGFRTALSLDPERAALRFSNSNRTLTYLVLQWVSSVSLLFNSTYCSSMVVGCYLLFGVCCLLLIVCCLWIFKVSMWNIEAKQVGKSSIWCIFRLENCRLSVSILSIFVESEITKSLFSSIHRTSFHYKTAGAKLFRGGVTVNMWPAVLQSKLHLAYSAQRFLILRCFAKSGSLPHAKKKEKKQKKEKVVSLVSLYRGSPTHLVAFGLANFF